MGGWVEGGFAEGGSGGLGGRGHIDEGEKHCRMEERSDGQV